MTSPLYVVYVWKQRRGETFKIAVLPRTQDLTPPCFAPPASSAFMPTAISRVRRATLQPVTGSPRVLVSVYFAGPLSPIVGYWSMN